MIGQREQKVCRHLINSCHRTTGGAFRAEHSFNDGRTDRQTFVLIYLLAIKMKSYQDRTYWLPTSEINFFVRYDAFFFVCQPCYNYILLSDFCNTIESPKILRVYMRVQPCFYPPPLNITPPITRVKMLFFLTDFHVRQLILFVFLKQKTFTGNIFL